MSLAASGESRVSNARSYDTESLPKTWKHFKTFDGKHYTIFAKLEFSAMSSA